MIERRQFHDRGAHFPQERTERLALLHREIRLGRRGEVERAPLVDSIRPAKYLSRLADGHAANRRVLVHAAHVVARCVRRTQTYSGRPARRSRNP